MGLFDDVFDEKVPSNLKCSLCGLAFEQCTRTICNHLFCYKCISEFAAKVGKCPTCSSRLTEDSFTNNIEMQLLVGRLRCSCKNDGCDWQGPFDGLAAHYTSCNYRLVSCDNSAMGCPRKVAFGLMGQHLGRCEYAAVACQYCSQVVPKCKMNDHIKMYCGASPDHIIDCPEGCGGKVLQSDMKKHIAQDCQAHVVPCTYQEFGCVYRGARSTIQTHCLKEVPAHMFLMSENLHVRDVAINEMKAFLKEFTVQVEKMQVFFGEAQEQSARDKQAMALQLAQSEARTSAVEAAVEKRLAEFQQSVFKIGKGVEKMQATVDGHTWELHKMVQDPMRIATASAVAFSAPQSPVLSSKPDQATSSTKIPPIAAARLQASAIMSPSTGPSNCRELHVDFKEGPYYKIQDAITDANIGDKVIVHPGTYRESIRMNKPIEMLGKGNLSDIIVECHDSDTFIFNTASGRIFNISFVQTGTGHWNCFDVQNGNLVVDSCDMKSSTLICVDIHGESTMPTFRRCKIHGCKGTGIFFHGLAQGIIEDCIICNNAMGGLEVTDAAKPIIKFCRISGNRRSAIIIHSNGKGSYQDNDIYENDMVAVEIRESGNGEFLRNRIYNHPSAGGVLMHKNAGGYFEKNDVCSNGLDGFLIREGAKPKLVRNRVNRNGQFGIQVVQGGWASIRECDLRENGRGGIFIAQECKMRVLQERNLGSTVSS